MQAQEILERISSLRQRFQQSREGSAEETLAAQVERSAKDNQLLDTTLRPLSITEEGPLPIRLSHRARRLLKEGRELLSHLRTLADEPHLHPDRTEAPAKLFHETAAMLDTAIRTIQAFPGSAIAQAHLCDGLEGVLAIVAERLEVIKVSAEVCKVESRTIDALADLLAKLSAGELTTIQDFLPLANQLLEEAAENMPLRFLHSSGDEPARFTAANSLTVAQVMARLVHDDPEYRGRAMEPVLAALVKDVGMVSVPAEVLTHQGPLDDFQRRIIERHALVGSEILKELGPSASWLAEPARTHHERLDGSGYPAGLQKDDISPLARLLAVCDVYAALASPRSHRSALEPRTALTDTLLLADRGALDPASAEKLLKISFYPVGCVVELADGAIGVVVGVNKPDKDFVDPARPIVSLLRENDLPLPFPRCLNLRTEKNRSVLRTLDATERNHLLGKQYPAIV